MPDKLKYAPSINGGSHLSHYTSSSKYIFCLFQQEMNTCFNNHIVQVISVWIKATIPPMYTINIIVCMLSATGLLVTPVLVLGY